MLYSSTDTIANATLVSQEMRDAFFMCKDELVTKLLHQRSPRMAQVMKLIAKQKGASSTTGCTGDITDLYRRAVEVEKQESGSPGIQLAPSPAIDFNEVIVDFELTTNDKVGRWAAALGPMFKDGAFQMSVPPDVIKAIGLPTVGDLDFYQAVLHEDVDRPMVKIFISAVYNNQLRTNMIYKGDIIERDFGRGPTVYERFFYDGFDFEGCGCSRGNSDRGWDQSTEVDLTCSRERNDATRKVQYEVDCNFCEVHEDGGVVDSVGHSRATTWIRNLVTS